MVEGEDTTATAAATVGAAPAEATAEALPQEAKPGRARAILRTALRVTRAILLVLAILGAIAGFVTVVNPHYPLRHWLFFIYAKLWIYSGFFALACVTIGSFALDGLTRRGSMPLRERIVLAFPVGVVAFFLAMFAGGLFHLHRPWFALALPAALLAAGAWPLAKRLRCVVRHVRAARRRPGDRRPVWHLPVLAIGLAGLGLIYFSILSPRNVAFDATFYHLGIAQEYAVRGGIERSPEGWGPIALPHLASLLYTWCFIFPGLGEWQRVEFCAHIEFVVFLFTLAAIPVLVRWLVPRARAGLAWVGTFLFPGVLLYDSALTIAADHIGALFAVPSYLALRRAWPVLEPRSCALLAVAVSGAVLTKYQGVFVLAFPVAAIILRALWLTAARALGRLRAKSGAPRSLSGPLIGLAVALAVGLLVTSPHWLKNLVWYGNPAYPYASEIFGTGQWGDDLPQLMKAWTAEQSQRWSPGKGGLWGTLKVLLTFSWEPHDWPEFHGKIPVFGSLFTLGMGILLFARGALRTWGVVVAAHVGVALWYLSFPQDRYIQIILPWMVAATVAAIALAWRANFVARILVLGLATLQLVWGGDIYFIHAHNMTKSSPAVVTTQLLEMGFKKKYADRFKLGGFLYDFARSPRLPKNARVLVHEHLPRLGLWRSMVADAAGLQWGLRYELHDSPTAVHETLRRMGVTHVITGTKSRELDSVAADLRYFDYVRTDGIEVDKSGGWRLLKLPDTAPSRRPNDIVLYLGCGHFYERGLHPLRALSIRQKGKPRPGAKIEPTERAGDDPADWSALLSNADFAVTDEKCEPAVPAGALEGFTAIADRKTEKLWSRKVGRVP